MKKRRIQKENQKSECRFPDAIAKTIIEMWDTVLRFQGNWNPNSLNQLKRKFSEEAQMDRKRRKREKFIRNLDC